MPTNKNAYYRIKILDRLLSESVVRRYTTGDLTDKCNDELKEIGQSTVTRRCIEEDIQLLKKILEKSKEFDREKRKYYAIPIKQTAFLTKRYPHLSEKFYKQFRRLLEKWMVLKTLNY